jgi:hypothetical protein
MEKENIEETQTEETTSYETDNENVDNNEVEETTDVEETTEVEDTTDKDAEIERLKEENKKLYARTKRVEKKAKPNEEQTENLELLEFFGKGGTREQYETAQTIMKGRDCSLSQALKDPLYIGYLEKKEAEKKEEESQVNSKRRVSQQTQGASKPGLSREDHKKLAKEAAQKIR